MATTCCAWQFYIYYATIHLKHINNSQYLPLRWFQFISLHCCVYCIDILFGHVCLLHEKVPFGIAASTQTEGNVSSLRSTPLNPFLSLRGPARFGCLATLGKSFQLRHFQLDGLHCCQVQAILTTAWTHRHCCMYEGYTLRGRSTTVCWDKTETVNCRFVRLLDLITCRATEKNNPWGKNVFAFINRMQVMLLYFCSTLVHS